MRADCLTPLKYSLFSSSGTLQCNSVFEIDTASHDLSNEDWN
jgi:hypothetical protein